MLNWFERWLLKGILKKIVRGRELAQLFANIRSTQDYYFYEDNYATREDCIFRVYMSEAANPDRFATLQKAVINAALKELP